MDNLKEKLLELIAKAKEIYAGDYTDHTEDEYIAEMLLDNGVTVQESARPLEEWHEDYGPVLWWKFPVEEEPYVGSPLDAEWPAYHTHWTPITVPEPPKENNDAIGDRKMYL